MPVEITRRDLSELSERVVAAAQTAWAMHDEVVQVMTTPVNGHAQMASLVAQGARRLEFVVEDDDPDVWDVLANVTPEDSWQLCALVRLPLMGLAHEHLRTSGYELQGWWAGETQIQFSSIEIA